MDNISHTNLTPGLVGLDDELGGVKLGPVG
jgi:hypothetical protein